MHDEIKKDNEKKINGIYYANNKCSALKIQITIVPPKRGNLFKLSYLK